MRVVRFRFNQCDRARYVKIIPPALVWIMAIAAAIAVAPGCAGNRNVNYWLANRAAPVGAVPLPTGVVRAPTDKMPPRAEPEAGEEEGGERRFESRLKVPSEIPGSGTQVVRLPDKTVDENAYNAAIRKLFPSLVDPPPMPEGEPGVPRPKVSLGEL